jgi:hypothetical protein
VRRCHLGEGSGPRPNVVVPGQTDCLITLTWAGGECWGCRQGGVAEAQNADPVRRFPSLQVRPCKLDFDAALTAHRRFVAWTQAGLWRRLHRAVLDRLGERAAIDWSRAVVDAASVRAKKGAR